MNQAWLITIIYFKGDTIIDTFVALLDATIPSEAIRQITTELYRTSLEPSGTNTTEIAQYRIREDGSVHTGEMYCGNDPCLYARYVYDIAIGPESAQSYLLRWREAHTTLQNGTQKIEYWEDFSTRMPMTYQNDLSM